MRGRMTAATSELLEKYDVSGPRYTSYPTILHWDDNPTINQWLESVKDNLDKAERSHGGAAIYVHIPFCRSLCTYCGCNSRITANPRAGSSYVQTVLCEWQLYSELLGRVDPL